MGNNFLLRRVGTHFVPRGWQINPILNMYPTLSTTAWAQKRAHPTDLVE